MTVQLAVLHLDHISTYYPVQPGGWKIDAAIRCIVIGHGIGRYMVPLDNVRSIQITEFPDTRPASSGKINPDIDDDENDW